MKRGQEDTVQCFIVRIYRRDSGDPSRVTGSVEQPGAEKRTVFHDTGELLGSMGCPVLPHAHGESGKRRIKGGGRS